MAEKFYLQTSWSGGLSDSDSFGGAGCFAEGVGVDIHSEPHVFRASQALTESSGSITTGLPVYSLKCSTGTTYFFDTNGLVYQRKSNGSYGTVYKDATGTVCGAGEHNGYIYWATGTCLSRVSTGSSWATQVTAGWGTLTASPYHQMVKNGIYLFILNDDDIASLDDTLGGGTLTLNGTSDVSLGSLPSNLQYTCLSNFGIDLVAGTKERSGMESCRLFRWDTVSPAWNSADDIPESMISTIITVDNYSLIQGGNAGNIYYYNGATLERYKKIPGDYQNKSMICYPDATCQFRGLGLLGVSNFSGNPCNEGIYSIGQYDRNYPMALNLEYAVSTGSVSNLEIGTLCSAGTLLMAGWRIGAKSGIDEISWGSKFTGAYLKTIAIGGTRYKQKQFGEYNVDYKSLPTSTDITLTYDKNYSAETGTITLDNSQTGYYKKSGDFSLEAGVAQFRLGLTVSGNNSPEVESFYTSFNERDVI